MSLKGKRQLVHRHLSLEQRFWMQVAPCTITGCWHWYGNVKNNGYSEIGHKGKHLPGHRVAYEVFRGPIAEGMVIDHLCRNRACVNPDHMEVVTSRENILRGESRPAQNARLTNCRRGHNNWQPLPNGGRRCRTCGAEWMRAKRADHKAAIEKIKQQHRWCVGVAS